LHERNSTTLGGTINYFGSYEYKLFVSSFACILKIKKKVKGNLLHAWDRACNGTFEMKNKVSGKLE